MLMNRGDSVTRPAEQCTEWIDGDRTAGDRQQNCGEYRPEQGQEVALCLAQTNQNEYNVNGGDKLCQIAA